MRILFVSLVILIVIGSLTWLGWRVLPRQRPQSTPTPLALRERQDFTNLRVLVSTPDDEHPRLFTCDRRACHAQSWPAEVAADAVTDGQTWYYYADNALTRHEPASGDTQPFVKKTTLVAPRGTYLSPDGKFLAYFLDNIHDARAQQSELWVYESQPKTTRLLVENLHVPDMLTTPRWNSAGSHLWYVANNGTKNQEKIELVVVSAHPSKAEARFRDLPWSDTELQTIAASGGMDISFTGRSLALVEPLSASRTRLNVIHEGTPTQSVTVSGTIPFVQWLEDGRLVYAVQESQAFSFWQLRSTVHSFLARRTGQLIQAQSDLAGELAAAVARTGTHQRLIALHLPSRTLQDFALLPGAANTAAVVALQSAPATSNTTADVAGITAVLDDAQLTAFIDHHLAAITGDPSARPIRVITTAQSNVVFLDYRTGGGDERRLLLTVRDAINPEWSIRARYEPTAGEWRKTQGGGLPDPAPVRVYEWEEGLKRWILKSSAS